MSNQGYYGGPQGGYPQQPGATQATAHHHNRATALLNKATTNKVRHRCKRNPRPSMFKNEDLMTAVVWAHVSPPYAAASSARKDVNAAPTAANAPRCAVKMDNDNLFR
ncbi:hypothetical protein KCU88_g2122, partial [Aureobasidium melanogenum]